MSELTTGTLLLGGKYKIEKSLGQGGFGITYLAERTNLGRKVCIKEFFMKEYSERAGSGVRALTLSAAMILGRYRDKFIKEAKTIAKLDHPGIVSILDVFEENGTAYYVMDFIEGENLNDLVTREGALSEERALGYIRQVADTLSYVHDNNIMHLDVNPSNIILRKSDDRVILIDFGSTAPPIGISTGYAPIEMMKVGGVSTFSPETDVYSLGATLYYLVTGQNPPEASERMKMLIEGEKFKFLKQISKSVANAIESAMQPVGCRPKDMAAFMEMFKEDKETIMNERNPKEIKNNNDRGKAGVGKKSSKSSSKTPNKDVNVPVTSITKKEDATLANGERESKNELKKGALLRGGKYKIEIVLGQGGFGITYLAEQTDLGRKVCIKEFFMKEYGERTATSATDSEATVRADDATVRTGVSAITSTAAEIMGRYKEKFIKEAKTIARLEHPGIVRIHEQFEENGTAYYVMEYIKGENLNDMVKREGALSEKRALGYIRQVADALSYVHGHKIIHLDVKPANIIVRKSDDKAILIDFGVAKQYDSTGTQTSTTHLGFSTGYAPIEMMKPGGVKAFSPETDVYSLGATLYYLVTGQNPPDAGEVLEEGLPEMPKKLSSSLRTAVITAMKKRTERPKSVAAFIELIDSKKKAEENTETEKKRKAEEKASKEAQRLELERVEAERKHKEEVIPDEKFDITKISASSRGNNTVFTIEVSMPSKMKKLYAFFSFSNPRTDSPITVLGDTTQFGDRIVIDNSSGKAKCKESFFNVDFSNSSLQREKEGRLFFDLYIILSTHSSSIKIMDDDVIHCYRFSIIHVPHLFKHDEWHSVKLFKQIQ